MEAAPATAGAARAVLVICYNRPEYLARTLSSVLAALPARARPWVYVSQDGAVPEVTAVIDAARSAFASAAPDVPFVHLQHAQSAANAARGAMAGYYALAQHFGWALRDVFGRGHPRAILIEDDLALAPDFFEYFEAVAPLLDEPGSDLLGASAWSDLGQPAFVDAAAPAAVFRSDFFGGLGWMLTAAVWAELAP